MSQRAGTQSASMQARASQQRLPLAESLLVYAKEDAEPPPPQLLKKFIAYARAYVHPLLSEEAKEACPACCLAGRYQEAQILKRWSREA